MIKSIPVLNIYGREWKIQNNAYIFLVLDLARFATEFFHSKVKTAGISVHSLDSTYPILFVYFQR